MGIVIYFIVGMALITYTSVSQYKRNREEFMETKFRSWIWWVVTVGCVLLWPVLVASCIPDIIREVRMLSK